MAGEKRNALYIGDAGRKILISGGCKSGKSMLAQRLAMRLSEKRYYIATMRPADAEDRARIARHRAERAGQRFHTIECADHITSVLEMEQIDRAGVFLVDSLTALLANEMFGRPGDGADAGSRVRRELLTLTRELQRVIFVSDDICFDAAMYEASTEAYRRALARLHIALAEECDTVVEMCAGIPVLRKSGPETGGGDGEGREQGDRWS